MTRAFDGPAASVEGAVPVPAARADDDASGLAARVGRAAAGPVLPLVATVMAFAIGYVQKLPCYATAWRHGPHRRYGEFCYSDMPILFRQRGLVAGIFPYSSDAWRHPLEYPVVTGLVMDWTARLARALAPDGSNPITVSRWYYHINVVVLLAFALVVTLSTRAALRRAGAPAALSLLVAAAPSMALAGTINWDLVAVALAMCALVAWGYRRPYVAGVLIGLGTAAKLYPALLLGPLLVVCLRRREIGGFLRATGAAVLAWAVVNAPIALLYPDGWMEFWRFNADRRADYGSIWHALAVTGSHVDGLNDLATALLVLLLAGVVAVGLWAPRAPTEGELAMLTVAAFLVTNKVYSPQYVLWLLPLVVLAIAHWPLRRLLLAWAIWQTAEMLYWMAIWRYFTDIPESQAWHYPAAVALRIAVTLGLCVMIVLSCLRREPRRGRLPAVG